MASDTLERVRLFLSASGMPALRRLQVDENGDAIELRGQVPTFYEKQVATECARRVAGVIRVVNLIVVSARSQACDEK
jgi:osmotically-inducible protein OsmY